MLSGFLHIASIFAKIFTDKTNVNIDRLGEFNQLLTLSQSYFFIHTYTKVTT